jgi:hypothetical protein
MMALFTTGEEIRVVSSVTVEKQTCANGVAIHSNLLFMEWSS